MGTWGFEPWEDDLAADWFAELFQKTKLAERVEKTLQKKDAEEYWPEIRAAAHVISALGEVWPWDVRKSHHELAIEKLEAVKNTEEFRGDSYMASEIDAQIAVLRERLQIDESTAAPTAESPKKIPAKYDPANAFAQLKDSDPKVRAAGAKWIGKHACSGPHIHTEWLDDPSTYTALLPLLDDPDPETAEEAICVFMSRTIREADRDQRAYPAAVRLMTTDRPGARWKGAIVAARLGGERCLDEVLALFTDKNKEVRKMVIGEASRGFLAAINADTTIPHAGREKLRQAALIALGDKTADVRLAAAHLLSNIGFRADIAAIKKAKKETKGAGYQQEFRWAIEHLEQKGR